jgi:hypothetical protein
MKTTTASATSGTRDASMQTLAKSFAEIEREVPGSPWVPLGNFMMDFFRNFPEHRAELIADPIQESSQHPITKINEEDESTENSQENDVHKWAVFCAASAEYLAHRYGLQVPQWVNDPAFAPLSEPWYFAPMALKKPHVRERIEQQTPLEFRLRNIYCGNRVYVDKYEAASAFRHTA